MKVPKLHFQYAYPLDQERRRLFEQKSFGEYPPIKTVREATEHFAGIWKKLNKGDRVMKMFTKLTGTTLLHDVTCFVFGAGLGAMSVPLLMPVWNRNNKPHTGDEFSEIVIHELAHSFVSVKGTKAYWGMVRDKYAKEGVSTQNHIIIFALLEVMLPKFFGAKKTKELLTQNHPDYQRALEIARAEGPQKLIDEFRSYTK